MHSRFLSLDVCVISSTTVAVIIDSSKPTTDIVAEYGSTISNVSRLSGTCGSPNIGKADGSSPLSLTYRRSSPNPSATAVSTPMQINGEGITVVTRGNKTMIARPRATIG